MRTTNTSLSSFTIAIIGLIGTAFVQCTITQLKAASAPPFAAFAGTYQGLFYEPAGVAYQSSGFVSATIGANGSFTATFKLRGKTASVSGQLSPDGRFSKSVAVGGLPRLSLQLELDTGGQDLLTGQVAAEGWTALIAANRGIYNSKTNPSPTTGKFTLAIPAAANSAAGAGGHGFGAVSISSAGSISLNGALGDGSKVTQTALLSKTGEWPLYLSLYAGQGAALGWLTFTNTGSSDIKGALNWMRLRQPASKLYAPGFSNQTEVVASVYRPTNNVRLLNFSTGEVALLNGNLARAIYNDIRLGADNRVTNLSTNKLSITVTNANGLFKGSVVNPVTRKAVTFSGAVLPRQNAGYGCFVGTDQSGDVVVSSGVSFSPAAVEESLPAGALSLQGVSPTGLNSLLSPLEFDLSGIRFDPDPSQVKLTINSNPVSGVEFKVGTHAVTFPPLLGDGRNEIAFSGMDLAGRPLYLSTVVWAGGNLLSVRLVNSKGAPFREPATVTLSLADDQTVSVQSQTSTGTIKFNNVPSSTILLDARASNNRSGSTGLAGSDGYANLTILGFAPPSAIDNNDFSQGADGWAVGLAPFEITPHTEGIPTLLPSAKAATSSRLTKPNMAPAAPRALNTWPVAVSLDAEDDQDMVLATSGEGEQSVSRTFKTHPGTSAVRVRYRFITSEVPGGYFGSKFNDYFRVSLRSQHGAQLREEANSMNGLGLDAFDYDTGATDWRNLTLPVDPGGDTIEVVVAVANVADGLFDSQVVVDFVQETKDQVRPLSLAWNKTKGGLSLFFEVKDGPLQQDTPIDIYWGNGPGYENRIGDAVFTYTAPAGTAEGSYGPVQIDGALLADDPENVTHLIAASSETAVKAVGDVKVKYGPQANAAVVWPEMIDVIKDGLRAAGQSLATINSTARTPADQARAMFNNLVHSGDTLEDIEYNVDVQKNGDGGTFHGYAAPGDAVIDTFVAAIAGMTADQIRANKTAIKAAMEAEIVNQGPSNVSKHCADPDLISVVDVDAGAFNESNGPLFVNSVAGRTHYIDERDSNGCYHLELQ